MGKESRKPGPDPKKPLEKIAVPSPFRAGGAGGRPIKGVIKRERKGLLLG